mmetsp:Transcript_4376/g.8838  ORF Transcript_4376/g.8838 Transcript_4376/m.8838 type:complete len:215 (+) Transcript_4376:45-689(+)
MGISLRSGGCAPRFPILHIPSLVPDSVHACWNGRFGPDHARAHLLSARAPLRHDHLLFFCQQHHGAVLVVVVAAIADGAELPHARAHPDKTSVPAALLGGGLRGDAAPLPRGLVPHHALHRGRALRRGRALHEDVLHDLRQAQLPLRPAQRRRGSTTRVRGGNPSGGRYPLRRAVLLRGEHVVPVGAPRNDDQRAHVGGPRSGRGGLYQNHCLL